MADLRVMFALLAGCGAADAQPAKTSGLTPPTGWQVLPDAAEAVKRAAAAPGITIDGVEAWGQPAMGCYGVWIALSGGSAGAERLTEEIVRGLSAEHITTTVQTGDPVGFTLEKAPYKGRMRARIVDDGRITALACVTTEREPVACEAACTRLLEAPW